MGQTLVVFVALLTLKNNVYRKYYDNFMQLMVDS